MLVSSSNVFYKNYDAQMDKELFKTLAKLYLDRNPAEIPDVCKNMFIASGQNYDKWSDSLYGKSMAASEAQLKSFASNAEYRDSNTIRWDTAWLMYTSIQELRTRKISPALTLYTNKLKFLDRLYMKCQ